MLLQSDGMLLLEVLHLVRNKNVCDDNFLILTVVHYRLLWKNKCGCSGQFINSLP